MLKGKVLFRYTYFQAGKSFVEGEEVTVDITSIEFRRQWWKLEFEGFKSQNLNGNFDLIPIEQAPIIEEEVQEKGKKGKGIKKPELDADNEVPSLDEK
jgi:hypothetical protein